MYFVTLANLVLTTKSNLGGTLLQGSDTTSASLQNAIRALVLFPDAQRKLQEELDRVVGAERVPTFADIPNLKYTLAFIEEARFNYRYLTRRLTAGSEP